MSGEHGEKCGGSDRPRPTNKSPGQQEQGAGRCHGPDAGDQVNRANWIARQAQSEPINPKYSRRFLVHPVPIRQFSVRQPPSYVGIFSFARSKGIPSNGVRTARVRKMIIANRKGLSARNLDEAKLATARTAGCRDSSPSGSVFVHTHSQSRVGAQSCRRKISLVSARLRTERSRPPEGSRC